MKRSDLIIIACVGLAIVALAVGIVVRVRGGEETGATPGKSPQIASQNSPKRAGEPAPAADMWPQIAMEQTIGPAGGSLEDASGVKVTVRPKTFDRNTRVSVRTTTQPAPAGRNIVAPIVELATDPPQQGYFREPLRVTLPFNGAVQKGLTAAYWSGSSWRRFGARIDANSRKLTFDTLSFSTYSAMIDDWKDWPEVFIDDPYARNPPAREVPRGAVVRLVMKLKGTPPSGLRLKGRLYPANTASGGSGSPVEVAPDPELPAAFAETGQARILPEIEA